MADGENNSNKSDNSWENWLGGWVQTAKEKSSSALEFVKKDLAEFTCTMQKETEKAVELTKDSLNREKTTQATNKVKAGLSSFLDNISKVLVIPPDDNYIQMKVAADGSGLYDRGKARLHALQLDASTYMDTPHGPPEQYSMWLESFNMDQHKGEISELLVSKVEVRALYTKLVPSDVSHAEFWQRYFYRVHQLQCDEARKQALMKRAEQTKGDSFSWDDDEEDWSGGEDNQSDWEKMPRQTQSCAASKSKSVDSVQTAPHTSTPSQNDLQDSSKDTVLSNPLDITNVADTKTDLLIAENKTDQDKGKHQAIVSLSETVVSKPEAVDIKSVTVANDFDVSEQCSSLTMLQQPSAELWSLHIPDDGVQGDLPDQDVVSEAVTPEGVSGVTEVVVKSDNVKPPVDTEKHHSIVTVQEPTHDDCVGVQGDRPDQDVMSQAATPQGVPEATEAVVKSDNIQPLVDTEKQHIVVTVHEPTQDDFGDKLSASLSKGQTENATSLPVEPETPCQPAQSTLQEKIANDVTSVFNKASDLQLLPQSPELAIDTASTETSVFSAAELVLENISETPEAEEISQQPSESTPGIAAMQSTQPQNFSTIPQIIHSVENADADAEHGALVQDVENSGDMKEIGMTIKGDMIVVGERVSPTSSDLSDTKEIGQEDDWEQDFDIEVTEEDLKAADDIAKRLSENLNVDDDWENWE
ncbi:unnamed protein product [Lymnaea stagnalis]|uniref:BSD domain-containing protein n=1 Tax=Lymnaea stagnalis TaxID=6523 RepID=A0AAV2HG37_LYMST